MDQMSFTDSKELQFKSVFLKISLTKQTLSHDLLGSKVANQIAFDRRDSNMFPKFESTMDHCCQALVKP